MNQDALFWVSEGVPIYYIFQHYVYTTTCRIQDMGQLKTNFLETFEITLFNQKSKEKVFELQVNQDALFWVSVGVPMYYIL